MQRKGLRKKGWHKQNWNPVVESQFSKKSNIWEAQHPSKWFKFSVIKRWTHLIRRPEAHCKQTRLTGLRHNNTNLKRNQWAAKRQDGAMGHNRWGRPWRKKDLSMSTDATHEKDGTTKTDSLLLKPNSRKRTCQNMKHDARIWKLRAAWELTQEAKPECIDKMQSEKLVVPGILSQGTYGNDESCCCKPTLQKVQHRGGNTDAVHEDNKALHERQGTAQIIYSFLI